MLAASPGRIRRLLADKGYDADWLRADLRKAGIVPVIPGTRSRKRPIRHDKERYKDRWRAEAVFCRLKDFWGCPVSMALAHFAWMAAD